MGRVTDLYPPPKLSKMGLDTKPRLRRPEWLSDDHASAWIDLVRCCQYAEIELCAADSALMIQTSALFAELKSAPSALSASKHAQLRLCLRALGIAGAEPEDAPP